MAEHDTEAREQKAWRRVLAASRTLMKGAGKTELVEAASSASHQDPQVQAMRRTEALAALLEGLVEVDATEATESKTTAKSRAKTIDTDE